MVASLSSSNLRLAGESKGLWSEPDFADSGLGLETERALAGVAGSWYPVGPKEWRLGSCWREAVSAVLWDRRRFGSRGEGELSWDEAKLLGNIVPER